jgi:CubicO group peptidase (beta-lactamase class C family)
MGVTAAAQAVAVKAGQDWSSLSETVLYRPLGMGRTTSRFADFMEMDNRAVGHVPVNGRFVPGPVRNPEVQSPAGGASSSVHDMAKWLSLILGQGRYQGREIVARAGLLPAISPQMQSAPAHDGKAASYYGFGFNVGTSDGGHRLLGHSGAFLLGAGTSIMMLPELGIGIVVLTNAWPLGVAEAISLTFLDMVQFGAPQKNWLEVVSPVFAQMRAAEGSLAGETPPAHPAPPQAYGAYAGTYDNAYYGPLIVRNSTAGLMLVAGPAQVTMPCTHWDGDAFAIHPGGENAPPGSAYQVSFTGRPPALVESDFFAEAENNRFTR